MTLLGCNAYEKELSLYRDDRLSPEQKARFEAHLSTCEACRVALQEAAVLQSVLARFPKAEYSAQRTDRIMQAIDRLETEETPSFWETLLAPMRIFVPATATVAACFLILGTLWTPSGPSSSATTPPATSVESVLLGDTTSQDEKAFLDELLTD